MLSRHQENKSFEFVEFCVRTFTPNFRIHFRRKMNSLDQQIKKTDGEKKYFQISPESIKLIAETVGYSNIPLSVTKSLAEDTSYRLRELIQSCVQILRHSKRPQLVSDDVNLALRWSDVPLLHGQQPQPPEFQYIQESDVYVTLDGTVDLTQEYTAHSEVEVYSEMKLGSQFLNTDYNRCKSDLHMKYFVKIIRCLLSTSKNLVEIGLKDLQENQQLQPLLSSLANFLQCLVGYSSENVLVVKQTLLIFHALINNPYLNIEPQKSNFLQILQNLLLGYNEFVFDGYILISGISHILTNMAMKKEIEQVVENMTSILTTSVIREPSRSLIEQCKAILLLRFLSTRVLADATKDSWDALFFKFQQEKKKNRHKHEAEDENDICCREVLISAIIDLLHYKIHLLSQEPELDEATTQQIWKEGGQLYSIANRLVASSALRIGEFPTIIRKRIRHSQCTSNNDETSELYWTMKNSKPSIQSRWQYNIYGNPSPQLKRTNLECIFDYPVKAQKKNTISIQVRNWRQRPCLKSKKNLQLTEKAAVSKFATFSYAKLKPVSKCVIVPSALHFYHPHKLIL